MTTGLAIPAVNGVQILYKTCIKSSIQIICSINAKSFSYTCKIKKISDKANSEMYTDNRISRLVVSGPHAFSTTSLFLKKRRAVHTAPSTATFTLKENRTRNVIKAGIINLCTLNFLQLVYTFIKILVYNNKPSKRLKHQKD
jgi:hypothetical protein